MQNVLLFPKFSVFHLFIYLFIYLSGLCIVMIVFVYDFTVMATLI